MAREIVQPVTVPSGEEWRNETKTTHPAYAQVRASRVSGSTNLYGSDFRHNHFMTISIRTSELRRTLSRDWHYGREELIEIALSESQWATFVSSPNMGDGVPCTLQRLNGQMVPGLPDPESRADQFSAEIKSKLDKTVARVKETLSRIDDMGMPKGKTRELKEGLEHLLTELRSNLPFVAKQFEEHVEDTVEAAKQEVHGYMTAVLQRAGVEALAANMPLQIEHKDSPAGREALSAAEGRADA
jgi:hypothetical protein